MRSFSASSPHAARLAHGECPPRTVHREEFGKGKSEKKGASMAEEKGISRRAFIGAAGAMAAVGAFGLAGCSSAAEAGDAAAAAAGPDVAPPDSFDEEMDCDILIIGGGGSGLAAAVEAGESGKSVIVLEARDVMGGNENIVEGCFGVDSQMQKDEGIVIDTSTIVHDEFRQGQYRIPGPNWLDLIKNSGENIDWLVAHGVQFMTVDPDHGVQKLFHRFEGDAGGTGYVPFMTDAAKAAGAEILMETHGDSLIQDDSGKVCGGYATKADGTVLKINAKAVLIATGSYRENDQYMRDLGFDPEHLTALGVPGHDGQGHAMAVAVGAASYRPYSCLIGDTSIPGLPGFFDGGKINPRFAQGYPINLWLNEYGERFLNEDFASENMMISMVPTAWHKRCWVFSCEQFVQDYIVMRDAGDPTNTTGEAYLDSDNSTAAEFEGAINDGLIFKFDTLEEVAEQAGFDPELFKETIERYNAYCADGLDGDYLKDPSLLVPFEEGPYYIAPLQAAANVPLGSLRTNRDFSVLDTNQEPIPGLYAIGAEGAMLWANVYTVNISGSCNANNINSARTAVKHAIANCM